MGAVQGSMSQPFGGRSGCQKNLGLLLTVGRQVVPQLVRRRRREIEQTTGIVGDCSFGC